MCTCPRSYFSLCHVNLYVLLLLLLLLRYSSLFVEHPLSHENGQFAFLSLPLADLGATYAVHLRLIEKLVMDFGC